MCRTADSLSADQVQRGYRTVLESMVIDRLLKSRSAAVKVTDDDVTKALAKFKEEQRFTGTDAELDAALKKVGQSLDKLKGKIHDELQKEKWVDSQIADKVAVSDDDVKSFYDKNPDKFEKPKSVRVSHILITVPGDATADVAAQKEKLAKATKDRITKGEDFAKVAGEVSDDPDSKDKGGDLIEYIEQGSMSDTLPEFEEAAFKLKKGEVSDPVKTKLGWHIIKVTDIKEASKVSYDEAKPDILDYLKGEKEKAAVDELLVSLRDKNAKIFLPPLPKTPAPEEGAQPPSQPPGDQGGGGSMEPGPTGSSAPDTMQPPPDKAAPGGKEPGGQ